jgi:hypothetical protein
MRRGHRLRRLPARLSPRAQIALVRKFPAAGYTFVLAGFLKILTMGAVATGAPNDAVRTAAGGRRCGRLGGPGARAVVDVAEGRVWQGQQQGHGRCCC